MEGRVRERKTGRQARDINSCNGKESLARLELISKLTLIKNGKGNPIQEAHYGTRSLPSISDITGELVLTERTEASEYPGKTRKSLGHEMKLIRETTPPRDEEEIQRQRKM